MTSSHSPASNSLGAAIVRLSSLLALAGVMLFATGCTTLSVDRDFSKITTMIPTPKFVPAGHELDVAEAAAAKLPGAQALCGVGSSMQPIYGDDTSVVVVPCDYEKLHAGMAVVFRNRSGFRVGHVIVDETKGGYITQGVNNTREDDDLVTPDNFIGVITQAYASADTKFRYEMAMNARLSGVTRAGVALPASVMVASAN